jgi:hypothetical protein
MDVKCYFTGENIQGEGNITIHVPTFFGINLCGMKDERDIAREAEFEILQRYNEVVKVVRVKRI